MVKIFVYCRTPTDDGNEYRVADSLNPLANPRRVTRVGLLSLARDKNVDVRTAYRNENGDWAEGAEVIVVNGFIGPFSRTAPTPPVADNLDELMLCTETDFVDYVER